ncbi:hypothetical protein BKA56DRAFT_145945 [Ilyonectria sp. MPI-CAGE-AT-0026]|nr:hypothetical protein BKA56DRAFT_145945 [Ilyonectria sp. MPI-CAGE-AT-0026]
MKRKRRHRALSLSFALLRSAVRLHLSLSLSLSLSLVRSRLSPLSPSLPASSVSRLIRIHPASSVFRFVHVPCPASLALVFVGGRTRTLHLCAFARSPPERSQPIDPTNRNRRAASLRRFSREGAAGKYARYRAPVGCPSQPRLSRRRTAAGLN